MSLFIDAVVVQGVKRLFTASIDVMSSDDTLVPLDLTPYHIKFQVLGASVANAEVLIAKIITQTTDEDIEGIINDAENGQFAFTITADDSIMLGIGEHPIMLQLLDATTDEELFTLTEGGTGSGEFNKLTVVQV